LATKAERFLSLGFAAVDWIEFFLPHGPGDVQGQPVDLDDEFAAFVVKAYRVDADGKRTVRRAFLSRPKGRSKSGLAGMLSCFEALGPCRFDHFAEAGEMSYWGYEYEEGEPVGAPLRYVEILNVATEESQAGNTYDGIYYMLHPDSCTPELLAEFGRIDVGLTRINLPDKRGFVEPVTSADSSKDGGKSTFIVADETHLWVLPRLKRLHGIMARNLLKRKVASGWMLETSTMYAKDEGSVAEGTHAYAQSIREGRTRDRTLLFDHRQASDKWQLAKRVERMKALREAYGPAAEWMNLAEICDSWDDPQVSEAEFRRYWLNQPVSTTGSWLPFGAWDKIARSTRVIEPGTRVVLTLDGSFNGDTTGIVITTVEAEPHQDVLAAWERPPDAGPDWRVPVSDVEAAAVKAALVYTVVELAADPYRWQRSLEVLAAEGLLVTEYPQSAQRMTPATKGFYSTVVDERMTHSGDPMLTRHIGNAVLHEDSRGTRIVKESKSSVRRIDLAVCAVMGLDRAAWHLANVETAQPFFAGWR
jgi:phage terminase large subunit-like protein